MTAGTAPPAARRRPRTARAYGLRLLADLLEAEPPVRRELEVPSTLHLDEVHGLLQAAFGWTDSHLHRFTLGSSAFAREHEHFLCPYDVEEGEDDGVAASDVRLDEVLRTAGDELLYTYDYGDEWRLLLTVREALPEPPPVRVCSGQGAAPEEDVGGVWAWNEREDDGNGTPYDPAQLARAVAEWERERLLPAELRDLRRHLGGTPELVRLDRLVGEAQLAAGDADVDEGDLRELLRPYAWLLDRVGDGITLTKAGWLPPAVVFAATEELGLGEHWIGKGNREDLSWPVSRLRSTAQSLGLLRKSKGRLLRTRAGVAATDDPVVLRKYLVLALSGPLADQFARQARALVLLRVAAGHADDGVLAGLLAAGGWRRSDRGEVTVHDEAVHDVMATLQPDRRARPTEGLRALARAALQRRR